MIGVVVMYVNVWLFQKKKMTSIVLFSSNVAPQISPTGSFFSPFISCQAKTWTKYRFKAWNCNTSVGVVVTFRIFSWDDKTKHIWLSITWGYNHNYNQRGMTQNHILYIKEMSYELYKKIRTENLFFLTRFSSRSLLL